MGWVQGTDSSPLEENESARQGMGQASSTTRIKYFKTQKQMTSYKQFIQPERRGKSAPW